MTAKRLIDGLADVTYVDATFSLIALACFITAALCVAEGAGYAATVFLFGGALEMWVTTWGSDE